MTEWYRHMEKARYRTPQELKAVLRTASILKGGRVVFNIAGNKYRVIVAIDYDRQLGYIRFVGTHAQYDQIKRLHEGLHIPYESLLAQSST